MDKQRFNKDARYYRNLIYKNEFRQAGLSREIKQVQFNRISLEMKINQIQETNKTIYKILYFNLFVNMCMMFYTLKDLNVELNYHDYSSTLFHVWEGYRKQMDTVFESFTRWHFRKRST